MFLNTFVGFVFELAQQPWFSAAHLQDISCWLRHCLSSRHFCINSWEFLVQILGEPVPLWRKRFENFDASYDDLSKNKLGRGCKKDDRERCLCREMDDT